ncbi:hypothetical protein D049_4300B, partial [Vibrio parahaemolyticus VPTS-2010]
FPPTAVTAWQSTLFWCEYVRSGNLYANVAKRHQSQ